MLSMEKFTERVGGWCVYKDGAATGTTFNGLAASSTVTTDAQHANVNEGAGIPIAKWSKARVTVILGALTASTSGAITAWVGKRGTKANDSSVVQLVAVSPLLGFEIDYIDSQAGKRLVGEIDLSRIPDSTDGNYDRVLWIKHVGTGDHVTITVDNIDPIIGYSKDTPVAGADYPGPVGP